MRKISIERKLGCEPLENRNLLAALVASVDVAPGPIEDFKTQARDFISSALDSVIEQQRQQPVASSIASASQLDDLGRELQVTNFTVELRPTGASKSLPASVVRSDLVFSFIIYPNNVVQMRAKLWAPIATGYAPIASIAQHSASSVFFDSAPQQAGRGLAEDPHQLPTGLTNREQGESNSAVMDWLAVGRNEASPASQLDVGGKEPTTAFDFSLVPPSLTESMLLLDYAEDGAASPDFAAIDVASEESLSNRPETQTGTKSTQQRADGAQASRAAELPVPLGMVEVSYPGGASSNTSDQTDCNAALFQVFVHSNTWLAGPAGRADVDAGGRATQRDSIASENQVVPLNETGEAEREQRLRHRVPLAAFSLALGIMLSRRRTESQDNK